MRPPSPVPTRPGYSSIPRGMSFDGFGVCINALEIGVRAILENPDG